MTLKLNYLDTRIEKMLGSVYTLMLNIELKDSTMFGQAGVKSLFISQTCVTQHHSFQRDLSK